MPAPTPLDPREEDLARLLERAGLTRVAARAFAALARGGTHGAAPLADAAGIARQDVSDAARELEARGLLRIEKQSTGGRPAHRYALAKDAARAVSELAAARRKALDDERAALDALEARFGS